MMWFRHLRQAPRAASPHLCRHGHRAVTAVLAGLGAIVAAAQGQALAADGPETTLGPAISRPFGQAAALQQGGTAANADLSTLDHNPAGLLLGRALTIEGSTAWRRENIQASELGVIDSVMSSVAAGLKFRQNSTAVGNRERRFTLGLADSAYQRKFLFGLAGDYKERPRFNSKNLITGEETAFEVRGGAIYEISQGLRLGASSGGYLDKQTDPHHTLGLAALLGPHFVINVDQLFVRDSATKTTGGLGVIFNQFFDLRASFGYHAKTKRQEGAFGFFLVSPRAALYYVASLPDMAEALVEHQAGLRLNMTP